MQMHDNDTLLNNSETPERRSSTSQRVIAFVLIAIPCLIIIFGLLTGTVIKPDLLNIVYGVAGYLPGVIAVAFVVLSNSLFKNNPRMRRASLFTFRSYSQSVLGLNEHERSVIDQAFRTAYRTIVMACVVILVCAVIGVQTTHLTYHPDVVSVFYILLGVLGILVYLPAAIMAWREDI